MEYLVLRNCYVRDRYFAKDEVRDLPDGFPIYEKNFKATGDDVETSSSTIEVTKKLRSGEYLCSKCHSVHRETSKQGQKHLKYK